MRAIAPSSDLLKRKNVFVGPSATSVTITTRFGYDDAPAGHMYDAGYTLGGWTADNPAGFCTAVGVTQYPNYCADEGQARANMLSRLQASQPTCTFSNARDDGAYASPYTSANVPYNSNKGTLTFNSQKFLLVDVMCPGWSSAQTSSYQFGKLQAYLCPSGFTAISSPQPGVNGWNLCRNTDTYDIVETNAKPVASCKVGHPCHPSTGDKSRSEQDFIFAGRPFVRYYHSIFALSKNRRIGEHWTHTYTDRLDYAYPYPFYSDQGTIENFTVVSSDWYRGESGRASTNMSTVRRT